MAPTEPDPILNGGHGATAPPPNLDTASETRPTIGELFSRLTDDATAFVRAEVALYRAQAGQKALSAGVIVALFGGALLLAQGAIIALLVGLLIAAAPVLGIWWSLLLVVLGTLAVAGVLVKLGLNRVTALLEPEDAP